jgi:hypothetical protein
MIFHILILASLMLAFDFMRICDKDFLGITSDFLVISFIFSNLLMPISCFT